MGVHLHHRHLHHKADQVKRLDDKNQQFSADVLEKHNYIKELISDTKTGLQVLQVDDDVDDSDVDEEVKDNWNNLMIMIR